MNLVSRIEKLEARLDSLGIGTDRIDYPILFEDDENGIRFYKLRSDGNWVWVNEEELNKYIARLKDETPGPLIFLPTEKD